MEPALLKSCCNRPPFQQWCLWEVCFCHVLILLRLHPLCVFGQVAKVRSRPLSCLVCLIYCIRTVRRLYAIARVSMEVSNWLGSWFISYILFTGLATYLYEGYILLAGHPSSLQRDYFSSWEHHEHISWTIFLNRNPFRQRSVPAGWKFTVVERKGIPPTKNCPPFRRRNYIQSNLPAFVLVYTG